MTDEIETHPVQNHRRYQERDNGSRVRTEVTLRAYEVYCEVYAPQPAMVTNGCRGGFGIGELVAFLYARSFPKDEWPARVEEALRGMQNLS